MKCFANMGKFHSSMAVSKTEELILQKRQQIAPLHK